MIGSLAKTIRNTNLFKNVPRYFGKVRRQSTLCILLFDWWIYLFLFTPRPHNAIFLLFKHSCVREELSNVVFLFRHNFNRSLCARTHIWWVCNRASYLWSVHFPNWYFSLNLQFPSVSMFISNSLNWIPIYRVDNFQQFQRQINIWYKPCWRKCSHFRFPYTLDFTENNHHHFSMMIRFSN